MMVFTIGVRYLSKLDEKILLLMLNKEGK